MMTDIRWWKAKGCTCPGDECSHCASGEYHAGPDVGILYSEHCSRCGYSEKWMVNADGTRTIIQSSKEPSIDIGDISTWKLGLG
jgi:hypothetical protein